MLTEAQKAEAKIAIQKVEKLLSENELQNYGHHSISVLLDLLIHLNDLLMKSNIYLSKKVAFTDDIVIDKENKIEDVTDLIRFFRNGGSHVDSPNRRLGEGTSAFNTFVGQVMDLELDDNVVQLKYSDDIAYNMGKHVLYLKRHIIRAFEEVKKNLQPYL